MKKIILVMMIMCGITFGVTTLTQYKDGADVLTEITSTSKMFDDGNDYFFGSMSIYTYKDGSDSTTYRYLLINDVDEIEGTDCICIVTCDENLNCISETSLFIDIERLYYSDDDHGYIIRISEKEQNFIVSNFKKEYLGALAFFDDVNDVICTDLINLNGYTKELNKIGGKLK